jgi:hypothetical protein
MFIRNFLFKECGVVPSETNSNTEEKRFIYGIYNNIGWTLVRWSSNHNNQLPIYFIF